MFGVWKRVLTGQEEGRLLREINDKFVMLKYEAAAVMAKRAELVLDITRMVLDAVVASSPASRAT